MDTREDVGTRKPRADAQRNRERLIDAAKDAFTEAGPDATLEEIARRAGVGIGTLYRHFPTRDAVIEAVYRRGFEQLAVSAARLMASEPPAEALHLWLRTFVDYMATKRLIAPALGTMTGDADALRESSGARIRETLSALLEAAIASGGVRPDVQPADLMQAMAGLSYGASNPGWEASTLRLIDILMDGLRQVPKS